MGYYLAIVTSIILAGMVVGTWVLLWLSASEDRVQQLRSLTGLVAVIAGDAAITGAAIWAIHEAGGENREWVVSIVTAAFTSVVSITTAYFGIKAVTNTAARAIGTPQTRKPPPGDPAARTPPADTPPASGGSPAAESVASPVEGEGADDSSTEGAVSTSERLSGESWLTRIKNKLPKSSKKGVRRPRDADGG
ncbi:PepSY domain-containing protein [Streptomyces palmae]|uniref:PepSY domain-containing protein n=1 Tax=Streptomyces palmae TaxID=1701085 RepID=A0A4Z0GYQ7_9ACTN|nr:PepSY domain-containing protein [Streptomyces palmae]TGB03038.1 PepSY domain-containing protein [Streptomyces palmae]